VFVVPPVHFGENWELILYAVFGVLLGHLAPPFLALLAWSKARFAALPLPLFVRFAAGGLIVGLISVLLPEVWGNGYSVVDAILHDRMLGWLLLAVLFAKVASTAATVGSGAVGGVFTPTLFIGAAVGALTGSTLRLALPHMTSGTSAFAVVGMGGFLAATTHAPLTSVLMIFEMTLDHQVVLPLILACVTAHYVAKVYRGGASIYRESLVPSAANGSMWQLRTIANLIRPAPAIAEEHTRVEDMLQRLPRRAVRAVYVVNADQELVASVDPRKVFNDLNQGSIDPHAAVSSVSSPLRSTLTPDMSLTAALEVFLRENETVLPVVSGAWRATLLGEISRHDLLLALQDRMSEAGPA
jgi:CIC family chloride channel protein